MKRIFVIFTSFVLFIGTINFSFACEFLKEKMLIIYLSIGLKNTSEKKSQLPIKFTSNNSGTFLGK